MKQKFYLKIEIRYNIPEDETVSDPDAYQRTYFNPEFYSDLFDTQKEAIDFGNKLIVDNRWIEQYPGYRNLELNNRVGYPLEAPQLKNGAQIFISVRAMDILDFEEFNGFLRKFKVDRILKEL